MIPSRYFGFAVAICCVLFFGTGCDFTVFTHRGLVKSNLRKYGDAISANDWEGAGSYHLKGFIWEQKGGKKMRGPRATEAFFKSIADIEGRDEFFVDVHSAEQMEETKISTDVTFQQHRVVSSMQMTFANVVWNAKILWIKRGNAEWKIAYIKEITERSRKKFSRT